MAQRHRSTIESLHQESRDLVASLEGKLAWIENHGSKEECAQAIEELDALEASYRFHQAMLSHQLEKEVVRHNEYLGINLNDSTRGAASLVALSRRRSPDGFRSYLVKCRILAEDTPYLAERFALGELTESQAMAILGPLRDVNAEQRQEFDRLFSQNPDMFESQGTKQISETVQCFTLKYASDEQCKKTKKAEEGRYVKFRRGENCIHISGRLPVIAGTAMQMHLRQESFRIVKSGDSRTREQIKADLLTTYMLAGQPEKMPLKLNVGLIMTDKTLFVGEREPAYLEGYGFVPSQFARELVAGDSIDTAQNFQDLEGPPLEDYIKRLETFPELQRIYTAPGDTELVAMDSKARVFPDGLRRFVRIRDRHCRTPFCNGLVDEIDHVVQHYLGGPTDVENAAGRCSTCNKAKESPGWVEVVALKGPHAIRISPLTTLSYVSKAPPATGAVHRTFPQLMHQSKWVQGFKHSLQQDDPRCGPDP